MFTPLRMPVGALIVSAKPEEKSEVTKVVSQYFEKSEPLLEGFPTYRLPADGAGKEEALVLADCGHMGNVAAASKTGYLLAAFQPNLTIFVGTAGSLRPDKCSVYDVVIPTLGVITKYYDKLEDAPGNWFWGGGKPSTHAGLGAFTRDRMRYKLRPQEKTFEHVGVGNSFVVEAKTKNDRGAGLDVGLESGNRSVRTPKVHLDTYMFSWEKVVASKHYQSLLSLELNTKAYAVDMESFGFLSAFSQFQKLAGGQDRSSLIVRGISDICGDKAESYDEGRNDLATRNAANVACRILRDGYLAL
jgi:nucleoside phosphorylase